ncbi:hypothetical protein LSH36_869g00043 [Paralvinella palmiformis]|uniref:Uncharacterized protein n=1 Tax=Paralvinella palmiformis TaxID=53620 RepID=A0AAD9IZ32_9ANNE|nr:hypothetical protein LSH36_869g00043 [Paralvinella palmiformis]
MSNYIPKSALCKDKMRKLWMTREAIAKHKMKQQVWKRSRLTGDRMDYTRATAEKKEFTTLTRNLCRTF